MDRSSSSAATSSSSSNSLSSSLLPPAPPPAPAEPRKRSKRGASCTECKILKKRCSGEIPCERCFKKGLRCVPQPKTTYAPHGAAPSHFVAAAAQASTAVASLSLQETVMVELAFQRANPKPLAELLGRCFLRQAMAPGARREVAVDIMRQWYLRGVACGGDASWGILDTCMTALNVAPAELEDPRWMMLDAAPEQRRVELLHQLGHDASNAPALVVDTFGPFAWQGTGAAGAGWDDAACTVHIPSLGGNGLHATAANPAFHHRFFAIQELHSAFLSKRTLHFLLCALLVAPEDRELFFDSFFKVLFSSTPTRIVQLGKGFDRHGRIALFIGEMRPARILEDGSPWGVATRFEPAPPSRHVTTNPGGNRCHLDFFRPRRAQQPSSSLSPAPSHTQQQQQHHAAAAAAAAAAEAADAPGSPAAWLEEAQQQQQSLAAAAGAALPAVGGLAVVPLPMPPPSTTTTPSTTTPVAELPPQVQPAWQPTTAAAAPGVAAQQEQGEEGARMPLPLFVAGGQEPQQQQQQRQQQPARTTPFAPPAPILAAMASASASNPASGAVPPGDQLSSPPAPELDLEFLEAVFMEEQQPLLLHSPSSQGPVE